ncbi:MAG: tetratricopeptide repeat protein, partial [Acidobacteriota bacterium]
IVRCDVGTIEFNAGDYARSVEELGGALELMDRLGLQPNLDRVHLHNNLAGSYFLQGQRGDAEREYRRAIELAEETIGADAAYVAALLTNLSRLLENMGRTEEASALLDRGQGILDRSDLHGDHLWRLHLHRIRAKVLTATGRYAEADALLRPWLPIIAAQPNLPDLERLSTARLLLENLRRWGRPAEEDAELRTFLE